MGYNSTGSDIVFTEAGKRAFIDFLVAFNRNAPVEIGAEGRLSALQLFRVVLSGTQPASGSMLLPQLRSITQAKKILFSYLVPERKLVRPSQVPYNERDKFWAAVYYELSWLIREDESEAPATAAGIEDRFFGGCDGNLDCALFEDFAKHYRADDLVCGLHERGWIDWEATHEVTFTGEDDERWGYRAVTGEDGQQAVHYIDYSKVFCEEPVEYDDENEEHRERGCCEDCEYFCIASDQSSYGGRPLCPQCIHRDGGGSDYSSDDQGPISI